MKNLAVGLAVVSLLGAMNSAVMAADSKPAKDPVVEKCKSQAKKDHVSADKLDAYVKTCVEKQKKAAPASK
jgi:hypothetical protein